MAGRNGKLVWAALVAPVVVVALLVAAWAIDAGAAEGTVLRNVELGGADIGGLSADELTQRIEELSSDLPDRPVRIETPDLAYETSAERIGLYVDVNETATAALEKGRNVPLPARPAVWLGGFISPLEVDFRYRVDHEVAAEELRSLEGDARLTPTEPRVESVDGGPFRTVPGKPGTGIETDELAGVLAAAAEATDPAAPITVTLEPGEIEPEIGIDAAEAARAEAESMAGTPLAVSAGDKEVVVRSDVLRRWIVFRPSAGGFDIGLDEEQVEAWLQESFADVTAPAKDASFTVEGGAVRLVPGVTGTTCCGDDAVDLVEEALQGTDRRATLEVDEVEPGFTTAEAEALGIKEEIGSPDEFGPTTRHPCCANRVLNIHRIADIIRGHVILPGQTFSINEFVGPRTVEKGFVVDGVIYEGKVTTDVGGGISQFATTLLNAALYAGLDFGEYQSHSLYISRYPRGHEATLSYPHPDLEIVNDTPYGVLIWPTYTDTSITVHLYSTRHAQVAIGEPTSRPDGNCTRWTTPRTRTYPDGRVDHDAVYARYRPAEGVNC